MAYDVVMNDDPANVIRMSLDRFDRRFGRHSLSYRHPKVEGDPLFIERIGIRPRARMYIFCVLTWAIINISFAIAFPKFGGGTLPLIILIAAITGGLMLSVLIIIAILARLIRVPLVIEERVDGLTCRRIDNTRSCRLDALDPILMIGQVRSTYQKNVLTFGLPKGIETDGYCVWLLLRADETQRFLSLEWCRGEDEARKLMEQWQQRLSVGNRTDDNLPSPPTKLHWVKI